MRIGINALYFIPGKVGGSETYIRNLISKLAEIDRENEYFIFTNRENFNEFKIENTNFHKVPCPINASLRAGRILWEHFILPFQTSKYKLDVLFSPAYTSPVFLPCKNIVLIYDLNYCHHPDDFSRLELLFWKMLIPLSARMSDRIIAASENSKKDIHGILKIPLDKITVMYGGANLLKYSAASTKEIEAGKAKYHTGESYILSVSAFYPHKNMRRLIQAYGILKKNYKIKHKLVLVGSGGLAYQTALDTIKYLSLESDVILTGWLSAENSHELYNLYRGADVFVFPSLFEGFGLPPLEAMACGTPVAVSGMTSLPEVVGDAGIIFNPMDTADMAEKIYSVISNHGLRKELIDRGIRQAGKFSWENSAKCLLSIFNEVCKTN